MNPHGPGGTSHPVHAHVWVLAPGWVAPDERRGELVVGLSGRVREVGGGDGRSLGFNSPQVGAVLADEPEPLPPARATRAAARTAPVGVWVLAGPARDRAPRDLCPTRPANQEHA